MSNWLDIGFYSLIGISSLIWFICFHGTRLLRAQQLKDMDLWDKEVSIDQDWLKSQDISLHAPRGRIEFISRIDKKHIYVVVFVTLTHQYNGNTVLKDGTISVPVDKLTLLSEGGEKLPRTEKKAKHVMRMPRIFRYIVYAAIAVLIWKFVVNIEEMTQFLVNITLLHR